MKKKLTKAISLSICAVMALSLAGCGEKAPASSAPAAAAVSAPSGSAACESISFSDASASDLTAAAFLTLGDKDTDATALYLPLEVTGDPVGMDNILSRADLEELFTLGVNNDCLKGLSLKASAKLESQEHSFVGLSIVKLLELCGADLSEKSSKTLFCGDNMLQTMIAADTKGIIVLAMDGNALSKPAVLVEGEANTFASGIDGIFAGSCCDDPHYEMHNRAPHDQSADITFTMNLYKGEELQKSVVLTTGQLEALALENPDQVYGAYYGIIGDRESYKKMGVGGFLDYFEGIRFDFLLREALGLESFEGSAVLYNRDGLKYAELEDLSYFTQPSDAYYMCTGNGGEIKGCIPVLAYSKNGSPLLPQHEHDSDAYVKYNNVKNALADMGIEGTNLGTVKNHSGPFVAALGNCDGLYGGYEMETGADCVMIDIIVK